jgi:NitT/TauT family transport system permease protein
MGVNMGKRFTATAPPLVWGGLFLLAWENLVNWRNIKPFLLPTPSAIWGQLKQDGGRFADAFSWGNIFPKPWQVVTVPLSETLFGGAALHTAANAIIGLLVGTFLAILIAGVAQRFSFVRDLINPLTASFNTMPIVALGPVFYSLFGATSDAARRVVVGLVAFFPVFVNLLRGLSNVDPVHDELMRSYAASPMSFLLKVRLPNSLGFFISGFRVAASLSVIAAVVVEYFGGLQNGLGARMASAMKLSQTPKAWAYITAAILTGLLFYVAGLLLERLVLPWQAHRQRADS